MNTQLRDLRSVVPMRTANALRSSGALGARRRLLFGSQCGSPADCLGSASAGRVRDLTAGKLTPKLSRRIADVRGRQYPTPSATPTSPNSKPGSGRSTRGSIVRRPQHVNLDGLHRVPPDRAWWPAVGAPLERGVRGVRRHCVPTTQIARLLDKEWLAHGVA